MKKCFYIVHTVTPLCVLLPLWLFTHSIASYTFNGYKIYTDFSLVFCCCVFGSSFFLLLFLFLLNFQKHNHAVYICIDNFSMAATKYISKYVSIMNASCIGTCKRRRKKRTKIYTHFLTFFSSSLYNFFYFHVMPILWVLPRRSAIFVVVVEMHYAFELCASRFDACSTLLTQVL